MPNELDLFFKELNNLAYNYVYWVHEPPKKLVINPSILSYIASLEDFYQRAELKAGVTIYSPVVRHFNLNVAVVVIAEDYDEKFMHFE